MSISKEDVRFWDRRTLDRRVRKGQISRKDVEKMVKSLPDVTDKIAPTESDESHSDSNGTSTGA